MPENPLENLNKKQTKEIKKHLKLVNQYSGDWHSEYRVCFALDTDLNAIQVIAGTDTTNTKWWWKEVCNDLSFIIDLWKD